MLRSLKRGVPEALLDVEKPRAICHLSSEPDASELTFAKRLAQTAEYKPPDGQVDQSAKAVAVAIELWCHRAHENVTSRQSRDFTCASSHRARKWSQASALSTRELLLFSLAEYGAKTSLSVLV